MLVAVAFSLAVSAVPGAAYDCRSSFLGCGHKKPPQYKQLVRQCKGVCRTFQDRCTTTFNKGKLRKRCFRSLVGTCILAGGSCTVVCDAANPCPSDKQCVDGQCIMDPPDRCGRGVCPAGYPHCGPDGRCWTLPCAELCGTSCCGGTFPVCGGDSACHGPDPCGGATCPLDYPHCGTDGRCWTFACETLCGTDNCCGGAYPVCHDDGGCYPDGSDDGGDLPTNLPPGDYSVTMCVSGYVSVPCRVVGTIPFQSRTQFQNALQSAINQWLAATAGLPDCTRGATTYSPFDGSSFTISFTVTCSSSGATVSETVNITVHRN